MERAGFFGKVAERIIFAGCMKLKPSENAAANARMLLPKMARKYFAAGRKAIHGKRPPEELHAFRLKTKRFRYTLELFRPLYGPNLERYLKSLRELQGALGKVSDYQAIQRVLGDDRELKAQIDKALKAKLRDLRQTWRQFDAEGKLKRWRTYLGGEHSRPAVKRAVKRVAKQSVRKQTREAAEGRKAQRAKPNGTGVVEAPATTRDRPSQNVLGPRAQAGAVSIT